MIKPSVALPARCDQVQNTDPDTEIKKEVNQWSGPVAWAGSQSVSQKSTEAGC